MFQRVRGSSEDTMIQRNAPSGILIAFLLQTLTARALSLPTANRTHPPRPCPGSLGQPTVLRYFLITSTLVVSAENAVNTPRPPTTLVNGSLRSRESCWSVA